MKLSCPHCQESFETAYYRIGLPVTCSRCSHTFEALRTHIIGYEQTGYEITFLELCSLLQDHLPQVQRIIAPPLGLRIVGSEESPAFIDSSESAVSLQQLHERIQSSPQIQFDLYQYAMSQWR